MLTQDTAVEMKIQDRLDHSDRVWLALAAHNFGLRNIEDARASAQTANSDPDLWVDVKSQLLHLDKKSNPNVSGAAYTNGKIAVKYVDNIQYYLTYLRLCSLIHDEKEPSTKRCLKIT